MKRALIYVGTGFANSFGMALKGLAVIILVVLLVACFVIAAVFSGAVAVCVGAWWSVKHGWKAFNAGR